MQVSTPVMAAADTITIDTHGHYYSVFNVDPFVSTAFHRLATATARSVGCLCIASCHAVRHPLKLFRDAAESKTRSWELVESGESESLIVRGESQLPLVLLASRQVTTAEGLELLALGTAAPLRHERTLSQTVGEVLSCDAIPVIPWGVGKWCFARRQALTRFLRNDNQRDDVFLGDIAGRTQWLTLGLSEGIRESTRWLHGSDPLPIRGGERTVGRLVSQLDEPFYMDRPRSSLIGALQKLKSSPKRCGQYDSLATMVSQQFKLRTRRTG